MKSAKDKALRSSHIREFFTFRTHNNLLFKSNGVEYGNGLLSTLMYTPAAENFAKISDSGIGYIRTMSDGDSPRHQNVTKMMDAKLADYLESVRTPMLFSDNSIYAVLLEDIAEVYDGFNMGNLSMSENFQQALQYIQEQTPGCQAGLYGSMPARLRSVGGDENDLDAIVSGVHAMHYIEKIVTAYDQLEEDIKSRTFHSQNILNMERSYRTWRISVAKYAGVPIDLRISQTKSDADSKCERLAPFFQRNVPSRAVEGWYKTHDISFSLTNYPRYILKDPSERIFNVTVFGYYPGVLKVGENVYLRGVCIDDEILVVPQHAEHAFIW